MTPKEVIRSTRWLTTAAALCLAVLAKSSCADDPFASVSAPAAPGPQGLPGADGTPGPPGEVTAQQLTDAIAGTSANNNAVQLFDTGTFTDPPSAYDLMAVANKLNELIQAMRR